MTLHWSNFDYQLWVSNGCDINIASDVYYLEFYYDGNKPINFHAGIFKHFVNLEGIDLSMCRLTTIPEDVWELTQLTKLHVYDNDICEISPKIKNLTKLKVFSCEDNNITAFPVEICQLTKLVDFCFYNNELDVLDPKVVDFITQIKFVNGEEDLSDDVL